MIDEIGLQRDRRVLAQDLHPACEPGRAERLVGLIGIIWRQFPEGLLPPHPPIRNRNIHRAVMAQIALLGNSRGDISGDRRCSRSSGPRMPPYTRPAWSKRRKCRKAGFGVHGPSPTARRGDGSSPSPRLKCDAANVSRMRQLALTVPARLPETFETPPARRRCATGSSRMRSPAACRAHLHFEVPAVGHLAHAEAEQCVAADRAHRSHVGIAHAIEQRERGRRSHSRRTAGGQFMLPRSRVPRAREPITKSARPSASGATRSGIASGQSLPSPSRNTTISQSAAASAPARQARP